MGAIGLKFSARSRFVSDGEDRERLPVALLSGFLGSGKTTLLNALLRDPRMADTAVAINEFGAVPLDQHLIDHGDGARPWSWPMAACAATSPATWRTRSCASSAAAKPARCRVSPG